MGVPKIHPVSGILINIIFAVRCLTLPLDYNPNATVLVGTWKNVTCDDPVITDHTLDPSTRWTYADADGAWRDALAAWNANPYPNGANISQFISDFFQGPQVLECGQTSTPTTCTAGTLSCRDTKWVAGHYIINSLIMINNANIALYNGINGAVGNISPTIGTFSSIFTIQIKDVSKIKMMFDTASMTFSVFASPFFANYVKPFLLAKDAKGVIGGISDKDYGIFKDIVTTQTVQGTTLAKDLTTSEKNDPQLDNQNTLSLILEGVIQIWLNATADSNHDKFNGSVFSNTQLESMLLGGNFMEQQQVPDDRATQQHITYASFGIIIPVAWSLSDQNINPFILDSESDCSALNPIPTFIDDDTAKRTRVCYNDRLYFLVSTCQGYAYGSCGFSNDVRNYGLSCGRNKFCTPLGIDELNGRQYGGLTYDQFVIGSLSGFIANNKENNWPQFDPLNVAEHYDTFTSGAGLEVPGIVQFPVCTGKVAFNNWWERLDVTPTYPCIANQPDPPCDQDHNGFWTCYPAPGSPGTKSRH